MNQPDPPSAILVACYSEHPLVPQLRKELAARGFHVLGIFEASIDAALKSIKSGEKFGVVTTGKDWEPVLTEGVLQYLNEGAEDAEPDSFAGVIGTGLGVLELHGGDAGNVQTLMAQAAKELVRKGARAICLGCAGMSGLERTIEDAVNEEDGKKMIAVIDGVRHGVRQLLSLTT
jgi:Asp/Glu/hydantoin racemase